MIRRITDNFRSVIRTQDGVVAIHMAVTLAALLGMAGLATDVGLVFQLQRQMQAAADAAAFSAALAVSTGYPANYTTEAYAVAGQNGFVNGANNVTVTVYSPPKAPPASTTDAANASAIQVVIKQKQSPLNPSVVYSGFTVSAQAVAVPVPSTTPPCIVQLSPAASPGISIGNGANVHLGTCGIEACSTNSTQALLINGGATVTAQGLSAAGAISLSGGLTINSTHNINSLAGCPTGICTANTACAKTPDPYAAQIASLTLPPGGCSLGTGQNYAWHSGNPAYTFNPGVWCGGVTFGQGLTYKLNPGVYYVNAGTFNVTGGATLNGTGVTIVLTGSGSSYANVNIAGAAFNVSAPTSGTTSGIALLGDPKGPSTDTNTFQGGSQQNIQGAMYFPSESVVINNGTATNSTACTQLVAGKISFQGGMSFGSSCINMGTSSLGGATGSNKLVE